MTLVLASPPDGQTLLPVGYVLLTLSPSLALSLSIGETRSCKIVSLKGMKGDEKGEGGKSEVWVADGRRNDEGNGDGGRTRWSRGREK